MENHLTIKQISDQLNISKQAVWQKIKRNPSKELSNNMIKKGNTVFITKKGQNIIKSMFYDVDVNADDIDVNVDGKVDEHVENKAKSHNVKREENPNRYQYDKDFNDSINNVYVNNDNVDVNEKIIDDRLIFFEEAKDEIVFLKNLVKELQEEKKEVYKILDQQQQLSLHDKNLIQKYEDENKELLLLMESNLNPEQEKTEPALVKEANPNIPSKKNWWKFWS